MKENTRVGYKPAKMTVFLLLFLIFILFFMGLGGYDLSAPDEPHYGLVAKEMITDNHWILPHRNQQPYPDKPPFFFWTIAFFSALAGGTVNAWTARLPSAVSATLVLWLMWRWRGKEDTPSHRPLFTVLILLSCFKFFFQARIAQIDMVLCVFTTAALTMGYSALTKKSFSALWLGIFMGLGILTKGPVGYLVPAGAIALFAAFNGREGWKNYPLKSLAWGFLPVVIWLGLLIIDVTLNNQWDYLNNLLFKQTLVRYFNPWHHHQPFYYFFVSILYDFLPWTPFFLLAIPFTKKSRQTLDSRQKYAWTVILFTMVFFTLSKGKRSIYILPAFPFAAYVTAAKLEYLMAKDRLTAWERAPGLITGMLIGFLGLGLLVVHAGWVTLPMEWIDTPLPKFQILGAGILVLVSAVYILNGALKNRIKSVIAGVLSSMIVVNIFFYSVLLPWVDPFRSSRNFTEKMNEIIAEHADKTSEPPVVGMVDYRSAHRFYGNYPIVELSNDRGFPRPDLPKIENFFATYPNGWLIVREKDWDLFLTTHELTPVIHIEQRIGSGKNYLLLTKDRSK